MSDLGETSSTADLVAAHAALIPPWMAFLDEQATIQRRLQHEMAESGVIVEEDTALSAVASEVPALDEDADPVAWLRGDVPPPATDPATERPIAPNEMEQVLADEESLVADLLVAEGDPATAAAVMSGLETGEPDTVDTAEVVAAVDEDASANGGEGYF